MGGVPMKKLVVLLVLLFFVQSARAADQAISGLTAASAMADANEFAINEAGTSKKLSGSQVKAWAGNVLRNQSTAAQSPAAGASTYLTNSNIAVPSGLLRIGTVFRWTLVFTKTAAGVAARSHVVRIGTAGTTGDAAIITLTSGTPTAAVDTGYQITTVTIRGPLSASCIAQGASMFTHQLSTTGLEANETQVLAVTSGTFNATTANLIVGLSVTTGASEALTYQQVIAEAYNL
jgi:hypothetical protein